MENKDVRMEEVVDMEETEKVGFGTKVKNGFKKNAKKLAVAGGVVAVGLICYVAGKKSIGIEIPVEDIGDAIEEFQEITE